eukprot:11062768-Heterocapsa_arctica.AAC.1
MPAASRASKVLDAAVAGSFPAPGGIAATASPMSTASWAKTTALWLLPDGCPAAGKPSSGRGGRCALH